MRAHIQNRDYIHLSNDGISPLRMSSETLDGTPVMHDPLDFGHPHDQAEEQVTEPFHWQYPNWARPGFHLYYYQHYGYFDHPLYTTKMPDGRKLVTSYGNGHRFDKPPMAEPLGMPSKRPKLEMVDVYNVDEFIEEVSLRLLNRFSSVASVTFSKSGKKRRVKPGNESPGVGQTERSKSRHSTTVVDSVMDGASQKLDDTVYNASWNSSPAASSKSTASETCSARARSDTRTTGLTIPDEFEITRGQRYLGQRRLRHREETNVKKELRLDLNVSEIPTRTAVREAIAWMKSNEKRHGDQTLLFGPDDLRNLSLEDLIDLYQAALAFGMLPRPKRLELELNERLTTTKFEYQTFRNFNRWLPVADSCLSRAINKSEYHTFGECYTDAEADMLKFFVSRLKNEALRTRIHDLGVVRRQTRQAKSNRGQEQDNLQVALQSAQVIARHQDSDQEVGKDKTSESTHAHPQAAIESSDQTPRRHRRRARRRQQSEEKGVSGTTIVGADYS